jgi:hypothetical protein
MKLAPNSLDERKYIKYLIKKYGKKRAINLIEYGNCDEL